MTAQSVRELVQTLVDHPFLKPSQVQALKQSAQRETDGKALLNTLVQHGWLTAYQASWVLQGRSRQLVIGPYVILEPLGEGGMGQIFKGRHPGLDRLAAIKVLRRDLVTDEEMVQRFMREIKLASQLPKHPHLVHAFDAGMVGSTYYLAMEYIDGVDLDHLIQQVGPLPVPQACAYICQAALGLQHAHEHGLVHRDIKPANLLVTPRPGRHGTDWGTVKVLDLGLARLHGQGAQPGQTILTLTTDNSMTMGTVDYMAPEQALDLHRADIRADIYSLGCTFYYLLTGRPPFGEGPLAIELMRHQQAEPPNLKELRPDVPAKLIPIVRRMLAKQPEERYQTPGEVAEVLTRLDSQRPRNWASRTGSGLAGVAGQARRHPRLALGAAALVLLLAVGGSLWSGGKQGTPPIATQIAPADGFFGRLAQESPLDQLDPARINGLPPEQRPEGTVALMTGHRLAENFIRFSPDGRFLAVCGDETHHELALYDLAGPEPQLYPLIGHTKCLYFVVFSPDGKLLISASNDNTARRWNLESLPPRFLGESPCARVNSMIFSPDGKSSVTATGQNVFLWRMLDGQLQSHNRLEAMTGPLAFTSQGHLLVCSAPTRHQIFLLDHTMPQPVERAVIALQFPLRAFALALEANQLATGDGATGVEIWDLNRTPPISRPLAVQSQQEAWTTGIRALAITHDGKAIAAGTNYGHLRIWDLSGPEPKQRVQVPPVKSGEPVVKLSFSSDGQRLIEQAANSVRVWNVATGQKLHQWDFDTVNTMDLAPDGRHIAIGAGNNLFILRLAAARNSR